METSRHKSLTKQPTLPKWWKVMQDEVKWCKARRYQPWRIPCEEQVVPFGNDFTWGQMFQIDLMKIQRHFYIRIVLTKDIIMIIINKSWELKYSLWWASDPAHPYQRWSRAPSEERESFVEKGSKRNLNGDLHCVESVLHRKNIVAGRVGGWVGRPFARLLQICCF